MPEVIPIDAGNIIAWLNVQIEKARRGDLPVDAIALYGDALMFVKNLPKLKPKTNGDRIRQMTDEQLAEWLNEIINQCGSDVCRLSRCPLYCCCAADIDCQKRWLKQGVQDA